VIARELSRNSARLAQAAGCARAANAATRQTPECTVKMMRRLTGNLGEFLEAGSLADVVTHVRQDRNTRSM